MDSRVEGAEKFAAKGVWEESKKNNWCEENHWKVRS